MANFYQEIRNNTRDREFSSRSRYSSSNRQNSDSKSFQNNRPGYSESSRRNDTQFDSRFDSSYQTHQSERNMAESKKLLCDIQRSLVGFQSVSSSLQSLPPGGGSSQGGIERYTTQAHRESKKSVNQNRSSSRSERRSRWERQNDEQTRTDRQIDDNRRGRDYQPRTDSAPVSSDTIPRTQTDPKSWFNKCLAARWPDAALQEMSFTTSTQVGSSQNWPLSFPCPSSLPGTSFPNPSVLQGQNPLITNQQNPLISSQQNRLIMNQQKPVDSNWKNEMWAFIQKSQNSQSVDPKLSLGGDGNAKRFENTPTSRDSRNAESSKFSCRFCQFYCDSEEVWTLHVNGKHHRTMMSSVAKSNPAQILNQNKESSKWLPKTCELCNVTCTTEENWKLHMDSVRHINRQNLTMLAQKSSHSQDKYGRTQTSQKTEDDRTENAQTGGQSTKSMDWKCVNESCGANNYSHRVDCYRCRTPKHQDRSENTDKISKPGEWDCPRVSCTGHNFPHRKTCYKCNEPRPSDVTISGTQTNKQSPKGQPRSDRQNLVSISATRKVWSNQTQESCHDNKQPSEKHEVISSDDNESYVDTDDRSNVPAYDDSAWNDEDDHDHLQVKIQEITRYVNDMDISQSRRDSILAKLTKYIQDNPELKLETLKDLTLTLTMTQMHDTQKQTAEPAAKKTGLQSIKAEGFVRDVAAMAIKLIAKKQSEKKAQESSTVSSVATNNTEKDKVVPSLPPGGIIHPPQPQPPHQQQSLMGMPPLASPIVFPQTIYHPATQMQLLGQSLPYRPVGYGMMKQGMPFLMSSEQQHPGMWPGLASLPPQPDALSMAPVSVTPAMHTATTAQATTTSKANLTTSADSKVNEKAEAVKKNASPTKSKATASTPPWRNASQTPGEQATEKASAFGKASPQLTSSKEQKAAPKQPEKGRFSELVSRAEKKPTAPPAANNKAAPGRAMSKPNKGTFNKVKNKGKPLQKGTFQGRKQAAGTSGQFQGKTQQPGAMGNADLVKSRSQDQDERQNMTSYQKHPDDGISADKGIDRLEEFRRDVAFLRRFQESPPYDPDVCSKGPRIMGLMHTIVSEDELPSYGRAADKDERDFSQHGLANRGTFGELKESDAFRRNVEIADSNVRPFDQQVSHSAFDAEWKDVPMRHYDNRRFDPNEAVYDKVSIGRQAGQPEMHYLDVDLRVKESVSRSAKDNVSFGMAERMSKKRRLQSESSHSDSVPNQKMKTEKRELDNVSFGLAEKMSKGLKESHEAVDCRKEEGMFRAPSAGRVENKKFSLNYRINREPPGVGVRYHDRGRRSQDKLAIPEPSRPDAVLGEDAHGFPDVDMTDEERALVDQVLLMTGATDPLKALQAVRMVNPAADPNSDLRADLIMPQSVAQGGPDVHEMVNDQERVVEDDGDENRAMVREVMAMAGIDDLEVANQALQMVQQSGEELMSIFSNMSPEKRNDYIQRGLREAEKGQRRDAEGHHQVERGHGNDKGRHQRDRSEHRSGREDQGREGRKGSGSERGKRHHGANSHDGRSRSRDHSHSRGRR